MNLNGVFYGFCTAHFRYAEQDFELLNLLNGKHTHKEKYSKYLSIEKYSLYISLYNVQLVQKVRVVIFHMFKICSKYVQICSKSYTCFFEMEGV